MFTGIIETLGTVLGVSRADQGTRLVVVPDIRFEGLRQGDSVAVNGVCLTVVEIDEERLGFDVSAETLSRTSLGEIRGGAKVNLERPLTLSARLGGHLVQGHVDGTGRLEQITPSGDGFVIRISFPTQLSRYIVEKGSISVDGISLTVASLRADWFEIAIIPHTWRVTNLSSLSPGSQVNLEVDVIAKYVEKLMARSE